MLALVQTTWILGAGGASHQKRKGCQSRRGQRVKLAAAPIDVGPAIRERLLERVWGVDYYGSSRTVDIHVRRLRMKLGHSVNNLETVRGVGYKMKEP